MGQNKEKKDQLTGLEDNFCSPDKSKLLFPKPGNYDKLTENGTINLVSICFIFFHFSIFQNFIFSYLLISFPQHFVVGSTFLPSLSVSWLIAGIELFRPPRGTRNSVIVVIVVVVLYLHLKLISGLVFIFSSWAVFFTWNPIITTQRYFLFMQANVGERGGLGTA